MSEPDGVMSTQDRLIYMANQIARNLAAHGREESIAMLAQHLRKFWDPRMRAQIMALAAARPEDFTPVAAAAVALLAEGNLDA